MGELEISPQIFHILTKIHNCSLDILFVRYSMSRRMFAFLNSCAFSLINMAVLRLKTLRRLYWVFFIIRRRLLRRKKPCTPNWWRWMWTIIDVPRLTRRHGDTRSARDVDDMAQRSTHGSALVFLRGKKSVDSASSEVKTVSSRLTAFVSRIDIVWWFVRFSETRWNEGRWMY